MTNDSKGGKTPSNSVFGADTVVAVDCPRLARFLAGEDVVFAADGTADVAVEVGRGSAVGACV